VLCSLKSATITTHFFSTLFLIALFCFDCIALHSSLFDCIALHSSFFDCIALHSSFFDCIPLHSFKLKTYTNYIVLSYIYICLIWIDKHMSFNAYFIHSLLAVFVTFLFIVLYCIALLYTVASPTVSYLFASYG
jgi:hypothetical protein